MGRKKKKNNFGGIPVPSSVDDVYSYPQKKKRGNSLQFGRLGWFMLIAIGLPILVMACSITLDFVNGIGEMFQPEPVVVEAPAPEYSAPPTTVQEGDTCVNCYNDYSEKGEDTLGKLARTVMVTVGAIVAIVAVVVVGGLGMKLGSGTTNHMGRTTQTAEERRQSEEDASAYGGWYAKYGGD